MPMSPTKMKCLDVDTEVAAHETFCELLADAVSRGKIRTDTGVVRRDVSACEFEFKQRASFEGSESWTDVWRHVPSGNCLMIVQPVNGKCFLIIPANNIDGMGGTFEI